MGILARMGLKEMAALGSKIQNAIIRLDPDTATEAQIDQLNSQFETMSLDLAKSNQELAREESEAVAAQKSYDRKKAAAQILQSQMNEATDATVKSGLEKSLGNLIAELESMKADVAREKSEADDARALRDQLQEATQAMAANLKEVRGALTQAKNRLKSAAAREAVAERSAEVAARIAGIKQGDSKFNTVLSALNATANQHEAAAAAAATRANLIAPASSTDANIEAAMRAAGGDPPKADLSSRLAAL